MIRKKPERSIAHLFDKIGKISTESVFEATGKHWSEWIPLLDKAGARSWTHAEIVAYLKKKHKLGPWWQQWVTVGFEIATARRVEGQNLKGEYMITATKSLPVTVKKVWKFLLSKEGQAIWLQPLFPVAMHPKTQFETEDGYFGEIRTVTPDRRIRVKWQDPNWSSTTTLQVTLVERPEGKMILVFDHTQIKDIRIQAKLRARWKNAANGIQIGMSLDI